MPSDAALLGKQPRLNREQHAAFAAYVKHRYGRFLLLFNLATMLAYNLYALADYWLIPDMSQTSVVLRLGLSATALVAMYWTFHRWQNIRLMDLQVPLQAIVCTFTWFELLKQSNAPNVENFAYAALIFLLVPNLGVRYSQRLMLLCSLAVSSVILGNALILYADNSKALLMFALAFLPVAVLSISIGYNNARRVKAEFLRLEEQQRQHSEQANIALQLQAQAFTDPLTLIGNRRAFDLELNRQWQQLQDAGRPFALVLIDIDYFKPYNDFYGHLAGDQCLRQVAYSLRTSLRSSQSKLFRYGGEEFALLLNDCRQEDLSLVTERLRQQVYALQIEHLQRNDSLQYVSISLGALMASTAFPNTKALFHACDEQLYEAKARGRNQVCLGHALPLS